MPYRKLSDKDQKAADEAARESQADIVLKPPGDKPVRCSRCGILVHEDDAVALFPVGGLCKDCYTDSRGTRS